MSNFDDWEKKILWPNVWENADKIFPEFDFKRNNNYWVSQNGLKVDGTVGEKSKVYIYENKPFYLKDFTRGGCAITKYLQDKGIVNSHTDALKFLADKARIEFSVTGSNKAEEIWDKLKPVKNHPYLEKKKIRHHGTRLGKKNELVIPMYFNERIQSLQRIFPNNKCFLKGADTKGCYFSIGTFKKDYPICICEGFSTGASIYESTEYLTYVTFFCGNLFDVTQFVRSLFPDGDIVICGDDDWKNEKNTGKVKARSAAVSINARVCFPVFNSGRREKETDFNDMWVRGDDGSIRVIIDESETITPNVPSHDEFPINALPPKLRKDILTVRDYSQVPTGLAVMSALGTISIAAQSLINVKHPKDFQVPCCLFFMSLAKSGERKTACDKIFTKELKERQRELFREQQENDRKYQAELRSWNSKIKMLESVIREKLKTSKSTEGFDKKLDELRLNEPEKPKTERLIYHDVTPEGLRKKLAYTWPTGGINSSEAGIVFGSYGMNKESIQRNIFALNQYWGGEDLLTDRATSEDVRVENPRFSFSLMVQPRVFSRFCLETKGLLEDSGFFSRFLFLYPKSRIGTRMHQESNFPELSFFSKRISELLNMEARRETDKNGHLLMSTMELTPEARKIYIDFSNECETRNKNSDFEESIDSKLAEQALRLAAILQLFENSFNPIGEDIMKGACEIVRHCRNDAVRIFDSLRPIEPQSPEALYKWLLKRCQENDHNFVKRSDAQKARVIKNKDEFNEALAKLENEDKIVMDGSNIIVNT